jgi:hypothetical protein
VQILATLRSLSMNALRLEGFWSITEGLAALAHDIPGLLVLPGCHEPAQALSSTGLGGDPPWAQNPSITLEAKGLIVWKARVKMPSPSLSV